MAVMARDTWTDERLDDLNARAARIEHRMDSGFTEANAEFRAVRAEAQGFRAEMKEEFRALRSDLNRLTYGLIGTMLVGFLGTITAIVTQT
jgi:hypothetical protein